MWKTLKVESVRIYLPYNDYCNNCKFKQYVSRDIRYRCNLFNGEIKRDGTNFIRLDVCKSVEVSE